ncbi:MAG: hypothetical protein JF612_11080, partial [Planctomycetia bacterium]|nr:hypothetical protein [Planctomycetia bacterium]
MSGSDRLLAIAFSPDGKSVACGVEQEVRLYDLSTSTAERVVTKHNAAVTSLAFTPDGAALVSGSHDQTTRCTNLATRKLEWQAPGYFEQVNSVAVSDDGALLVTGSSDHRFARGRLDAAARFIGPGTVRLWDARTGYMIRRLGDPTEQIMAVAISADGRRVASGGAAADGKGVVSVWDAATGARLSSLNDQTKEVLAVAFSQNGKLLATASADGVATIRDSQSGRVIHTLPDHQGGGTSVVFSPDSQTLYCGEAPGGTKTWDVPTGRLLRSFHGANSTTELFTIDRRINTLSISRDGVQLLSCGSSVNNEFMSPAKLCDARSGSLVRDFAGEKTHGRPTVLSPDGSIIATGGKSIKLWDARTGKLLRELYGHLKRTQSIAFSADGRLIIAGGSYGTTNFWEVASGRHLVTLFTFVDSRTGAITDDWLAYHPDGYYDGSPGCEKHLAWRAGDDLVTPATLAASLHRPD